MKTLLPIAIVCAATLTSACATAGYMLPLVAYRRHAPPPPHAYAAPSPVGRWDNVMLLPVSTPVLALMTDGRQVGGTLIAANAGALQVRTVSGDVELPAADVMRVDRMPPPASRDNVEQGGRGAAAGVGVVGVLGLIAGQMPPARLFAAGAIIGASGSVQAAAAARSPATVYLAPRPGGVVR